MNDYDSKMAEWSRMYEMHKELSKAHVPIVREYYAKAVLVDPRQFTDLSIQDMVTTFPFTLPRKPDGKIDDDDPRFSAWRRAAMIDTQAMIQCEMVGADDSWYDYIPNGLKVLSLLADVENVEWLEWASQPRLVEESEERGIFFQDCTSAIVMSQIAEEIDEEWEE